MKSKDYAALAMIAIVSGAIALFISNTFISSGENRSQAVEVVEPLSADFKRPPARYFNENSINPTQLIQIGPSIDSTPFGAE